jgi:hypothetical protein
MSLSTVVFLEEAKTWSNSQPLSLAQFAVQSLRRLEYRESYLGFDQRIGRPLLDCHYRCRLNVFGRSTKVHDDKHLLKPREQAGEYFPEWNADFCDAMKAL